MKTLWTALLLNLLLCCSLSQGLSAATITVTTTDGGAPSVDGQCSLHEAIQNSNNNTQTHADCTGGSGTDTIQFNIAGSPATVHTITPSVGIPNLSDAVIIDGSTQGDADCSDLDLRIVINGSWNGDSSGFGGLNLLTNGITIRGLVITNIDGNAIEISSTGATSLANGNKIECNILGPNESGTFPTSSTGSGYGTRLRAIEISDSSFNTIGGSNDTQRNVISGGTDNSLRLDGSNAANNLIQNNYIGTDITGNGQPFDIDQATNVFGSSSGGISIQNGAHTNTVMDNVISNNGYAGIAFFMAGTDNQVLNNTIGVGADGSTSLPNAIIGIIIGNSTDLTIGGSGEGNTILNNPTGVLIYAISGTSNGHSILFNQISNTSSINTVFSSINHIFDGREIDYAVFTASPLTSLSYDNDNDQNGPNRLQPYPVLDGDNAIFTVSRCPCQVQFFDATTGEYLEEMTGVTEGENLIPNSLIGSSIVAASTNESTGDTSFYSTSALVASSDDSTDDDTEETTNNDSDGDTTTVLYIGSVNCSLTARSVNHQSNVIYFFWILLPLILLSIKRRTHY